MAFAFTLPACSDAKKDDPAPPTIVGTWTIRTERYEYNYHDPNWADTDVTNTTAPGTTYTFTADGEGTGVVPGFSTIPGTYTLSGKKLTINGTGVTSVSEVV